MVMAATKGIVESKDRSKLMEYGGQISIEKSWAKSLLTRMNFVKCKGSTAAKLPPPPPLGVCKSKAVLPGENYGGCVLAITLCLKWS